jgi:hypothetical protein
MRIPKEAVRLPQKMRNFMLVLSSLSTSPAAPKEKGDHPTCVLLPAIAKATYVNTTAPVPIAAAGAASTRLHQATMPLAAEICIPDCATRLLTCTFR